MVNILNDSLKEFKVKIRCNYLDVRQGEINNNKELPLLFAKIMNINPDDIITYGIRDWGREPYGAVCHMWRPGVKSWEISDIMEGFSLNNERIKNVHICGETYSHFQGFMEGAVRTANNVILKINEKS